MATSSLLTAPSTFLTPSKHRNPSPRKPDPWRNRHRHFNHKITTACSTSIANNESQLAKDDLLGLIADEERGIRTERNPSKRSKIIEAVDALSVYGKDTVTTGSSLSGTWRMMWTTEKEQLFIIKNASLFGTEAGDILQVIDVERGRGRLNNVITFPPSGVFFVRSSMEVVSPQRVNFRFMSAVLRGKDWEFPLPPFGQGCATILLIGKESNCYHFIGWEGGLAPAYNIGSGLMAVISLCGVCTSTTLLFPFLFWH